MNWLIGLIAIIGLGGSAILLWALIKFVLRETWELYGVFVICSDNPEDDYHTPPEIMAKVYATDRQKREGSREPCKS